LSILKPSLRVLRGIRQLHLSGYRGCLQGLRNGRSQKACAQATLSLQAAFDPSVASTARKGALVRWLDHGARRHTALHGAKPMWPHL